jgi:hypothetical protein
MAATPKQEAAAGATAQIFGLPATPELVAIFLVYFVQGILGLSRLAVSFYFKDDLHMDPAELCVFFRKPARLQRGLSLFLAFG